MADEAMAPRQPIDINALEGFLNSLRSYSQDLVQHLESGQRLCHYTSLEGALGIVRGGDLWLSNARFSNDDEEMLYGHRVVDRVLADLLSKARGKARARWLQRLGEAIAAARSDHVYICCFCEQDNLLSQWRGYAENGGGVSLEFDGLGFTRFTGPDCEHGLMRLWKVFYKPAQQEKIVRKCIAYPHWPPASDDDRIRYIVDALQFFMPTFKNADFKDEAERRLIFTPKPGVVPQPQFRTRQGLLVPYYKLSELANDPSFRLPISSVLVGPSVHRQLIVESAKMLMAQSGYPDVPVTPSSTPFRG